MNGYQSKRRRSSAILSDTPSKKVSKAWTKALSITLGLAGSFSLLLVPRPASANEPLEWARVDFLRNRVQLVPRQQRARRARISDVLSTGDALRTARSSRAELRFNDGSLARIGERATFRFTPDTRNFQLTNGTILLLIPPERGRSTIQTPNAVTGIQGSALFVRYIPETDTTIVGALTNNPEGPMVLFNRDGSEQQALRANQIGVIQGDQITQLFQFDGELFWQSSGLAEGFNYNDSSSSGSDALDAVRQEIREAISTQSPISDENVVDTPGSFELPAADEVPPSDVGTDDSDSINLDIDDDFSGEDLEEDVPLEFEDSPAAEYLNSSETESEESLDVGVRNSLKPAALTDDEDADDEDVVTASGDSDVEDADEAVEEEDVVTQSESETLTQDGKPAILPADDPPADDLPASENEDVANESETPPVVASPTTSDPNATPTALTDDDDNGTTDDGETGDSGVDSGTDEPGDGEGEPPVIDGEENPDGEAPIITEGEDNPDGETPITGGEINDETDPGTQTPDAEAPDAETPTDGLPGEGSDPAVNELPEDITDENSGELPAPVDEAAGDLPDNSPDNDAPILLEEDAPPLEDEVIPISGPDGGEPPENNDVLELDPADLGPSGLEDAPLGDTVDGGATDAPPDAPVTSMPVDAVPVNVVPTDVPPTEVVPVETIPADSELAPGGLPAEPLPQEVESVDVPLIAPMTEMMEESMNESMGNRMDEMNNGNDGPVEMDNPSEDTPDGIPGTVPVPGDNAPPDGGDDVPVAPPADNTPPATPAGNPGDVEGGGSEEGPPEVRGTV